MDRNNNLRDGVRDAYSAAADRPGGKHPFPVGKRFAKSIGYPKEILKSLPSYAVDSFAGVSNVSIFADIEEGATVLDIGCGAGLDALISAQRVGRGGRVIGVDFSDSMIGRARQAAKDAGLSEIEFHLADAERLPVETGAIDVVIANGIFNLNPWREKIFKEIGRVTKSGGAVFAAELILKDAQPEQETACDLKNWFA